MIGLAGARDLDAAIGAFVDALEPDAIAQPDVVPIWETVVAGAQRMNAAVTLLARRVEETSAWVRTGHRSAAEFVAKRSGTSVAAARTQLDTARKVDELPAIEERLRSGALSGAQAALVAEGASVNPDATDRLLEQAEQGSLKDLRDEVLRIRAAADPDPDTTQRRIQSRRGYRSWRDGEGGWHAALYGTALAGARFEARLKPLIDEEFANARADGRHEPRDASAFDAVMALADQPAGDDAKKPTRFTTIVRVEFDALRRGTLEDRDTCDIPGLGPISASTARELLGDSILKLVITQGCRRGDRHPPRSRPHDSPKDRPAVVLPHVLGCRLRPRRPRDRPPRPLRDEPRNAPRQPRPAVQVPPRPQDP